MTDYSELVKALRYCKVDYCSSCLGCPMYEDYEGSGCINEMHDSAAAAIEELSKTVKDLTTKVECSPMQISGNAFDRAIEAWNEKERKAVQE